jgi:hypothetical protein
MSDERAFAAAEPFPDEVVTKTLVRYFDLPGGAGRLALVTLDNGFDHTRPNTFGLGGLAALDAALDEVEREDVVGVGITGKPFVFAVGADLKALECGGILAPRRPPGPLSASGTIRSTGMSSLLSHAPGWPVVVLGRNPARVIACSIRGASASRRGSRARSLSLVASARATAARPVWR